MKSISVIPGIIPELRQRENGPATGKDVRLAGARRQRDNRQCSGKQKCAGTWNAMSMALIDVEDETPLPGIEWTIRVDREEAGRYGTDVVSVGALIQVVTNGVSGRHLPAR